MVKIIVTLRQPMNDLEVEYFRENEDKSLYL